VTMRTSLKHVSRTKRARRSQQRIYPGESLAEPLVKHLNRNPSKNLLDLVESHQRNRKATDGPNSRELAKWLKANVNAILADYKFSPVVEEMGNRWKVEWAVLDRQGEDAALVPFLLDLAERGLLHKIRRCANPKCGKWLFASTDSKRFHTPACALKNFRSSKEWKEHRAEYMREWRANPRHKAGKRRKR
jgi:hypothetical protein